MPFKVIAEVILDPKIWGDDDDIKSSAEGFEEDGWDDGVVGLVHEDIMHFIDSASWKVLYIHPDAMKNI